MPSGTNEEDPTFDAVWGSEVHTVKVTVSGTGGTATVNSGSDYRG